MQPYQGEGTTGSGVLQVGYPSLGSSHDVLPPRLRYQSSNDKNETTETQIRFRVATLPCDVGFEPRDMLPFRILHLVE